jgi:hypothetical protein
MFGQLAPFAWFGRVDGAAVPPLVPPLVPPFVLGAGDADGSGLAAETTAAARRRAAARPARRSGPSA